MDEDMNPLYILGWPLGYVMEWIYKLIPNYGWDIILFTLLITLVKIPLQINQQKSMARMSAYQPLVADIQKKYRDKPDKQQEELMKLQEQGYEAYLLLVIQMKGVTRFEPNWDTHREFGETLQKAQKAGVHILAYDCLVEPDRMEIQDPVPVRLERD